MNATLDDDAIIAGAVPDPLHLFNAWFSEASAAEINDPNAMVLATVDAAGLPDARTVLLKDHDERGFTFYTNTTSAKGVALAANPSAALLFYWKSLRRQVRVRGPVSPVAPDEADAYFASRARGSRIGAWASDQSQPVADRAELERRVAAREQEFPDHVPRPPHWSGYRVTPHHMEFWREGEFRLHNRFRYSRADEKARWQVTRLFP